MRLVREKDGLTIDGVSHIKPQILAHIGATISTVVSLYVVAERNVVSMFDSLWWVSLVNLYLLIGMGIFWFLSEFKQERAMVKDGRHVTGREWKFWTWSLSRWQDIVIPELAGAIYTGAVYLLVFLLYKFM